MLCAVDPSPENGEQTLTTLRYADQAKKITTRPVENIDHTKRMVRELHEQVAELRACACAAASAWQDASHHTTWRLQRNLSRQMPSPPLGSRCCRTALRNPRCRHVRLRGTSSAARG